MPARQVPRQLVLASASPARRRLLDAAGLRADVQVSGVDEDDVADASTSEVVAVLAERKARAVAATLAPGPLVLGCDSLLDLDGEAMGKPASPAEAVARWHRMRGRSGTLCTGHALIDTTTGTLVAEVATTVVRFGTPTDAEVVAYVATGEPLAVAGAFTLDGRGGAFVDGVDGDPGTVLGLSLPTLRRLLARLDVALVDQWS